MIMAKNSMKVKACKKCKNLFETFKDTDYCPACAHELNKVFNTVKKYIRDNNSAGIHEVSEACHVSPKIIIQWVREERLYFTEESEIAIPCLKCGNKISIGKYCDKCRNEMKRDLGQMKSYLKPAPQVEDDTFVKVRTNERLRFTRTNQ